MGIRRVLLALTALAIAAGAPPPAAAGESAFLRPPRVQLGDAPLGAEADQVVVMWQSAPLDAGSRFAAEVRLPGGDWVEAGPIVGEESNGRLLSSLEISGLAWNSMHAYRISLVENGEVTAAWQGEFRTRLQALDPRPFAFAAVGDSAWSQAIGPFEEVQAAIAGSGAGFSLLLGDLAYPDGSREQLDARFDADTATASAVWASDHLEYPAYGNHDLHSPGGIPTQESFAVPLPVLPPGEPAGRTYSFDHGVAHFVTFDTNSITSPARLEALIDWVEADLAASEAAWKIVFGHHPVGGVPDKPELAGYPWYAEALIERLGGAGADLLFAGHSHTFSWTYPLTGVDGSSIGFIRDPDGDFRQGAGLVQVVSGLGGRSIRPGRHSAPFVAAGYAAPEARYGFAMVTVSSRRVEVSYVAAGSGEVVGGFAITIPGRAFGAGRFAR